MRFATHGPLARYLLPYAVCWFEGGVHWCTSYGYYQGKCDGKDCSVLEDFHRSLKLEGGVVEWGRSF